MLPCASPSEISRENSDSMEDQHGDTTFNSSTTLVPISCYEPFSKARSSIGTSFASVLHPSFLVSQASSAFRSPLLQAAHASSLRYANTEIPITTALIVDVTASARVRSPVFDSDFSSSMSYRSPEFPSAVSEFSSPLSLASNGGDNLVLDEEVDLFFSAKGPVIVQQQLSSHSTVDLPLVQGSTTLQMLSLQHQSSERQVVPCVAPPPPTTIRSKSEDLTHSTSLLSIDEVPPPRVAGSLHRFKSTPLRDEVCCNTAIVSSNQPALTLQSGPENPFTRTASTQPLSPPTPVPVGSQWLHLSRQPLLNEKCMSHFHVLDEAKERIISRISLVASKLGPGKAHPSHVADLIALVEKEFNEARLQTTQKFLQRAKGQSAIEADPKYVAYQAKRTKQTIRHSQKKKNATPLSAPTCTTAPMILDEEADAEVARVAKGRSAPSKPVVRGATVEAEGPIEQTRAIQHLPDHLHSASTVTPPLSEARVRRNGIESCPTVKSVPSPLHNRNSAGDDGAKVQFSASNPAIPEEQQEEEEENQENVTLLAGEPASVETRFKTPPPHGELLSPPALVPLRARSVEFQSHAQMHTTARRKLEFSMNKPLNNTPTRSSSRIPAASTASSAASPSSASARLPPKTEPMRVWFEGHLDDPYPSAEMKLLFCEQTGLTYDQVQHWFINVRMRQWKPLLKKRNQEQAKLKKLQQQTKAASSENPSGSEVSPKSVEAIAVSTTSTCTSVMKRGGSKKKNQSTKKKFGKKHARPDPLNAEDDELEENEGEPSCKRIKVEPSTTDVTTSISLVVSLASDDDAMLCDEKMQDVPVACFTPSQPAVEIAASASVGTIAMQESFNSGLSSTPTDAAAQVPLLSHELSAHQFFVGTFVPSGTAAKNLPSSNSMNTIRFKQSKLAH